MKVCSGESEKYMIDMRRGRVIDQLTKLMIMPKGLAAGKSVYECTADFQWFFYFTPLCVVYKNERLRRRYESVILEIARKNGKTFMIAVVFILLFFLEPRFSRFFRWHQTGNCRKSCTAQSARSCGQAPHFAMRLSSRETKSSAR